MLGECGLRTNGDQNTIPVVEGTQIGKAIMFWSMGPQHSEHWLKLKKKKESKHNTKDGHQTTREENKRGREGKRPTNLKQLTKW